MGKEMAGHLMKKSGHQLFVYTRTKAKADDLVKNGATYCETPRELAAQVDYLFLMVGYPKDLEDLVFDPEKGILDCMKQGSYFIDHTTSTPSLAERIAQALKPKGVLCVDAPVSGGDTGAKNGCVVVMAGGEEGAFNTVKPLMDCYSSKIYHMGPPGAGQHTKMAN
jgi:3-hydroxyisobutyrate dehydrogenase